MGAAAAVLCLCAARLPATGALLALAVSLPPVRRALPAAAAAVAAAVLPAARLGVPRACRLLLLLTAEAAAPRATRQPRRALLGARPAVAGRYAGERAWEGRRPQGAERGV